MQKKNAMTDSKTVDLLDFIRPDPNKDGSLYVQLTRSITQAIHEQILKPGDYLPPQRDMAEKLNISRVTVRKAIEVLEGQGLVVQRQGAGTIISAKQEQASIHKNLSVLNSFTEDMKQRGMEPNSKWIDRSVVIASPKEAIALNLSPGMTVNRFVRVRFASDIPMAFETASVPEDLIDSVDTVESLYLSLEKNNARPIRALQTITAQNADKHVAQYLQISPGDAVLYIERQGFDGNNRPVEFTRSFYRGDIYDFVTELKGSFL